MLNFHVPKNSPPRRIKIYKKGGGEKREVTGVYQKRVLEAQRPCSSRITLGHGRRSPTTTGDRGTEEGPGEGRRVQENQGEEEEGADKWEE